jgi:hypothetical protein
MANFIHWALLHLVLIGRLPEPDPEVFRLQRHHRAERDRWKNRGSLFDLPNLLDARQSYHRIPSPVMARRLPPHLRHHLVSRRCLSCPSVPL